MVWTVHKPADHLLRKQYKDEQKNKPQKANSATVAAAATLTINPLFATLTAALAKVQDGE